MRGFRAASCLCYLDWRQCTGGSAGRVTVVKHPAPSHCLSSRGLRRNAARDRFKIPDLKIGTYDRLVQLSDELEKISSSVESVTSRLFRQMMESRPVSPSQTSNCPSAALSPTACMRESVHLSGEMARGGQWP